MMDNFLILLSKNEMYCSSNKIKLKMRNFLYYDYKKQFQSDR